MKIFWDGTFDESRSYYPHSSTSLSSTARFLSFLILPHWSFPQSSSPFHLSSSSSTSLPPTLPHLRLILFLQLLPRLWLFHLVRSLSTTLIPILFHHQTPLHPSLGLLLSLLGTISKIVTLFVLPLIMASPLLL